jgi:uncharacterized Zn finger protein (UPF0148 family)
MNREPDTTTLCPTCGFPIHVFLLATPDVCCPHCRHAWERATSDRTAATRDSRRDTRSIDDLV